MIYILLIFLCIKIIIDIIYVGVRCSVFKEGCDASQTLCPLERHWQSEPPLPAEQPLPLSFYISKWVLKQVREFQWATKPFTKTYIFPYSPSRQPFLSDAWIKQRKCPSKFVAWKINISLDCWYLFLINPETLSKFQGTGGVPERTEKLTKVIIGLKGS